MGCEHYRRNVKLQCNTCQKWYTCRLCHDDAEDHALPRKETKNMLCMPCGYAQKAGDECVRCGRLAARYYCGICKLWNDDPDASTYHCDGCGICRVGAGLGKDFFHCKVCARCWWCLPLFPATDIRIPTDQLGKMAKPNRVVASASLSRPRTRTDAVRVPWTATAPSAASTCSRLRNA